MSEVDGSEESAGPPRTQTKNAPSPSLSRSLFLLLFSSNPPVQPAIPHAKPDRVYDIKYWVRDARRGGMVVGGTNTRFIDVSSVDVGPAAVAAEAAPAGAPPAVGAPYRWKKRVPLLDNPNNGYT